MVIKETEEAVRRKQQVIKLWYKLRPNNSVIEICKLTGLSETMVSHYLTLHLKDISLNPVRTKSRLGDTVYDAYQNLYTKAFNYLKEGNNIQYNRLKDYYKKIQDYEMLAAVVKAKDEYEKHNK